jgi:hypothetical protein
MRRILTLFTMTIFAVNLFGQQVEVINLKHSQEFGFHAGATTGIGLSYRFWPGKNGVQITALPIKTNDYVFINLGLTGLHTFYDSNYFRFFGYLGSSFSIDDDDYYSDSDNYSDRTKKLNVGIGPGFAFGSRVRFNVMAGYGFYDVLGKFNIYPTGEIGLYFRL